MLLFVNLEAREENVLLVVNCSPVEFPPMISLQCTEGAECKAAGEGPCVID